MELLLILILTASLSITVGYFGIAVEQGAKKLAQNHSIAKIVETGLLFPVVEKFVEFADSLDNIRQQVQTILHRAKIAVYIFLGILVFILVIKQPSFLVLVILGLIVGLIFKLNKQ